MLCRMLGATGVARKPGSHFYKPSLEAWMRAHGVEAGGYNSREDALAAVLAAARDTAGRGHYGLRLQQGSLPYLMTQLKLLFPGETSEVARLEAAFGPIAFVYLHRQDTLAQAISRVIAEQTGLWHRGADGTELERRAPPREPVYDAAAIARHLDDLRAQKSAWATWFADEGVTPLRLTYEALAQDPQGALAQVLAWIGLDPALSRDVAVPTARLADARSDAWASRFAERVPNLVQDDPR